MIICRLRETAHILFLQEFIDTSFPLVGIPIAFSYIVSTASNLLRSPLISENMGRCSHKGCGKEFDTSTADSDNICIYHPGTPVFHEGLKSWSCCNTVNKPVLDFDEFMKIAGCTRGTHSAESPKQDLPKPTASTNENVKVTETGDGKELYTTSSTRTNFTSKDGLLATPAVASLAPTPVTVQEEEEDLDATVAPGTICRHNGCNVVFESDEENRTGDGPGTSCKYHPAKPIFHEGSKGYHCCKRRVLEFDEFLKIEGCKQGKHVFVPKSRQDNAEELVDCRVDHYQTPTTVHVSVFAKQADSTRSTVKFEEERVSLRYFQTTTTKLNGPTWEIHIDFYLPGSKRFKRSLNLFGPINASGSSFKFYGTKVELTLKKSDGKSWTLLEKTDRDLGNIALTFGVGGRTGTIGAKELAM
ncbi:hypothetical protein EW146_g966 [Bondarzewia mesenterica]|uniref:CHORD domain-containing protein n=1 Tax=Bondarzewia mesenterica TaxID=1095465 RepID=A0A4V6S1K7_9AGAM|nr:hypothetical protein EW146_g966 [Bondarzewia mesenterica]